MPKDWEKYQENRTLIDAFKRQRENINFGISFTMYRKARICAENYEIARYKQEKTGCPYFIDWDKPVGLR